MLLVAFGAALLGAVARESSRQLGRSLRKAAAALTQAVRENEEGEGGTVPEAVRQLRIPDRALYVFGADGTLLHPDTAAEWIRRVAASVASGTPQLVERDLPDGTTERLYAEPIRLAGGERRIVVAGVQALEIEHRYPGLLLAFAAAATAALLLAGLGGWILARQGHTDVALRHPRAPEEYVNSLTAIGAEAERLRGILSNVLTLATADAGAWPQRRESLFLDDVLLDAASGARVLAEERHVRLDIDALDELPVRGDPELLRRLVMILLDNAIKFTPEGGVIRLRCEHADGTGRVSVEDTGPGISDEALAHVFERFYRADPARGRVAGAGLGLPIARWIAESHGGTVELRREPAGGTVATFTLPLESPSHG